MSQLKTIEDKRSTPNAPVLMTSLAGTFLSNIYLGVGALIVNIITARVLGPDGKGAYSLIMSFLMASSIIAGLGFGQANVYFIGRGVPARKIIANSLFLATFGGGLVAILLYFSAPFFSKQFAALPIIYVQIIAVILPFQLLLVFCRHIFLGEGRVGTYNLIRNVQSTLQIAILLGLMVINEFSVRDAIIAMIGAILLTLILNLLLLRASISIAGDLKQFKKQLAYGLRAYFAELANFLNRRLDIFLIAFFLNLQAVGLYSVAVAVTQIMNNLPTAASTVLFSTSATSSEEKMNLLTPRACRVIFTTLSVAAMLIFGLSHYIIILIGGTQYLPAILPLKLLLPGMVAIGIHVTLYSDLAGRGRPEIGTVASAIALIGTLVLDIILIPRLGIAGAAIASTIAYTAGAVFILVSFMRLTQNSLSEMLIPKWHDIQALRESIYQTITSKDRRNST